MLVHGLEVVSSKHKYNKREWRVNLDSLSQTDKTIPSWFERIIPYGTPTVKAIFDDTNLLARGEE
jgi:hypothetical protein